MAGQSPAFTLLFHGPGYTGKGLETAVADAVAGPVYGCSTSGEITPAGYSSDSLVALQFPARHFTCVARRIDGLRDFSLKSGRELLLSMRWELHQRAPGAKAENTFALLLIDSLSQMEEFVAAALGAELGNVRLIGASSGDNWLLHRTPVLFEGRHFDDSAVVLLVHSSRRFAHYNFHNFIPSHKRAVITSASPAQRLVHEINGRPAFSEYARLCNLDPASIDRDVLSLFPAIISVGDRDYPRGFLEVLDDGSLRCACAIDEGVIFRVADQVDYMGQMEEAFARMHRDAGADVVVLGFECAARKQMVVNQGQLAEARALFAMHNVWGFSCMGEQSNALNANNSFNCLALEQGQ